ncbi:MAG: NUDIX hydrolase [Acidimicrobiales bacterium]
MTERAGPEFRVALDAVIVAVTDERPKVLSVGAPDPAVGSAGPGADNDDGSGFRLPSGLLEFDDRTLELSLRRFVRQESGLEVGYAEQLYTFGDAGRDARTLLGPAAGAGSRGARVLSIAYLALVREAPPQARAAWVDWYDLYPWEDHREGRPPVIDEVIEPALGAWVAASPNAAEAELREERAEVVFGLGGVPWDGVRVLERYELLYEVGLLEESTVRTGPIVQSVALQGDHRRIVATALGRLRGKLTYRPVVFELLPAAFTLLALQRLVEALSGVRLHKQNFRRLVEGAGLVEGTGLMAPSGGRPAELFRFRRDVLRERPRPGVGMPWTRS